MQSERDWASYKFTDRDIRDYPDLREAAYEYLKVYTGEFDFLRDVKRVYLEFDGVTVGMVRGVLNCMRNDPRAVPLLLEIMKGPRPPITSEDEDDIVVPISRKRSRIDETPACADIQPHYAHGWGRNNCKGIPWPIQRELFHMPAKIKRPFALAKSGTLVHRVASDQHAVLWYPPYHEYGYGRCELSVKLMCRYPSFLRNPELLDQDHADSMWFLLGIGMCRHCETVNAAASQD